MKKSILKSFLFYLAGTLITVSLCLLVTEISLRIFDPFPAAIEGSKVNLLKNVVVVFDNGNKKSKLDRKVTASANEVGFRGDSVGEFKKSDIRILLIGGSTTQCLYLSDGFTWGDHLKRNLTSLIPNKKISVMNAGLDGHSTFGHIKLLKLYSNVIRDLSPTHVVIMTGINDISIAEARNWDLRTFENTQPDSFLSHFYIYIYYENIKNIDKRYGTWNFSERELVLDKNIELGSNDYAAKNTEYYAGYPSKESDVKKSIDGAGGYNQRVARIINLLKNINDPKIIFVTQAAIFGPAIDPSSGVNLGRLNLKQWSGDTKWAALQEYNNAIRKLASPDITVFDLANALPKDSKYFYDDVHFTNEGANVVGRILANDFYNSFKPF